MVSGQECPLALPTHPLLLFGYGLIKDFLNKNKDIECEHEMGRFELETRVELKMRDEQRWSLRRGQGRRTILQEVAEECLRYNINTITFKLAGYLTNYS